MGAPVALRAHGRKADEEGLMTAITEMPYSALAEGESDGRTGPDSSRAWTRVRSRRGDGKGYLGTSKHEESRDTSSFRLIG
jgi:hypothetical protein